MATRIRSDQVTTPFAAGSRSGAWTTDGLSSVYAAVDPPQNDINTSKHTTMPTPTAGDKVPVVRWVYGPIAAHDFTGETVSAEMVLELLEQGTGNPLVGNAYGAILIRIIAPDQAERAVLLDYTRDDVAINAEGANQARQLLDAAPLNPVQAQTGDYIAIEMGAELTANGNQNDAIYYRVGYNGTDMVAGDTNTAQSPWVEFSGDLQIQAPDAPPVVTITSPTATSITIPAGTKLVVEATATDDVDGDLSASLAWTSSNTDDGTAGGIGAGASLTLDTTGWADGARTITASATDSASQTGTDSFTLTIGTAAATTTGRREPMFISGKYGAGLTVPAAILYDVSEAAYTGTLSAGDVLVSKDGGAKAAITTLPTKNANGTSWTVQLSAAETAAKSVELFYASGSVVPFLTIVTFGDPAAWDTSYDVVVGSDGRAEANLVKINDQALTGTGPIDLA